MSDRNSARAQKLGDLIKKARENATRSQEECSRMLGISTEQFDQAEKGEYLISLPDLESLSIYLKVPIGYFWGSEKLKPVSSPADFANLMDLRHRVIAVLLRQLRLDERKTQKELAEAIGIDRKEMREYETGKVAIPYLYLEQLSQQLGVTIEYFVDIKRGPLGRHEAEFKLIKIFQELSPELQNFLTNPVNVRYIDTSWRLSNMDVEKLRQIAESILDITY